MARASQPSNIVPSIRTPIFCLTSMPSSFILPACGTKVRPHRGHTAGTHLDPLRLHLAQLLQLLLAHVRVALDVLALVCALQRAQVGVGVVCVVWGWDELPGAQRVHAALVYLHVVELLVRERRCVYVSDACVGEGESKALTGVEVLDEARELFLGLILGYCLWVDLAFFDEPGAEFLLFCVEAADVSGWAGGQAEHTHSDSVMMPYFPHWWWPTAPAFLL